MFPASSGLDNQPADPARRGVHAQPLVDRPLPGLGPRRLAHVQHASVRLAEDRGHPPLARQATAQRRPAGRRAPTGTGGPRCARACGGGSGAVPVRSRGSGRHPPGRSASRRCATAARRPSRRCWCAGRGPRDGSPRCPPAAAASRPPPSRCGPCRPPARRSRRAGRRTDGGPAAVRCAARPSPRAWSCSGATDPRAASAEPSRGARRPARSARRAVPMASGCRSAALSKHVLIRSCRVTVGCRSNRSAVRWRRRVSIVSRWRSRRSLARCRAFRPMVSQSQPSSSPRALRWRSQCHAARSEAGAAMRLTRLPRTADGAAAWPTGRRARRRPSAGGPAPGSRRRPAAGGADGGAAGTGTGRTRRTRSTS